jgi:hypothetical protein
MGQINLAQAKGPCIIRWCVKSFQPWGDPMYGFIYAIESIQRDFERVRKGNPERFGAYIWVYLGSIVGFLLSLGSLVIAFAAYDEQGIFSLPVLFSAVVISLTILFAVKERRIRRKAQKVLDENEREALATLRTINRSSSQSSQSLSEMVLLMKRQSDELKRMSRISGDTILSGNITVSGQGILIIGSELINSMNRNPEIADDLKILAGFVQQSGSEESKELLNELIKRTNAGDNKVVTAALWERLIKLLPSIETLTDVFIKLSRFFASSTTGIPI